MEDASPLSTTIYPLRSALAIWTGHTPNNGLYMETYSESEISSDGMSRPLSDALSALLRMIQTPTI